MDGCEPKEMLSQWRKAVKAQESRPKILCRECSAVNNSRTRVPIQRIRSIQQRLNEIVESNNLSWLNLQRRSFPTLLILLSKINSVWNCIPARNSRNWTIIPNLRNTMMEAICIIFSNDSMPGREFLFWLRGVKFSKALIFSQWFLTKRIFGQSIISIVSCFLWICRSEIFMVFRLYGSLRAGFAMRFNGESEAKRGGDRWH